MEYKLCKNPKEARTEDYRGTIWAEDVDTDPQLQALRQNVRRHNAEVRRVSRKHGRTIGKLLRVRLMGRGPRVEHAQNENRYARCYDSYLPLHLAETFDVYVGEDTHNQHQLKRELKTGMTPGEMQRVDSLQNEIWRIEIEARCRKRTREYS